MTRPSVFSPNQKEGKYSVRGIGIVYAKPDLLLTNAHPSSLGKGTEVLVQVLGIGLQPALGIETSRIRTPELFAVVHRVGGH